LNQASVFRVFTEFGGKFLPSLAEIVVKTYVIMSEKQENNFSLIYNRLQILLRRLAKNYYRVWRHFYRVWRKIFTEFGGNTSHGRARMCTETRYINPNMSICQRTCFVRRAERCVSQCDVDMLFALNVRCFELSRFRAKR
jgi:hypothetical protein